MGELAGIYSPRKIVLDKDLSNVQNIILSQGSSALLATMINRLNWAWIRVHDAVIIPQFQPKEINYGLDHFGVAEH
jgi:hypothetical protein